MTRIEEAIKTIDSLTLRQVSATEHQTLSDAIRILARVRDAAKDRAPKAPESIPFPPPRPEHIGMTVWSYCLKGMKIDAIKQQRTNSGMTLADSKDYVERECAEALAYAAKAGNRD